MLTGINFSPPLYFFLNFCIQLVFPTSIEELRIQSLIFIIIGIVLSFLLTRKIFGTVAAFIATILVASQSNLLLSQAQEARHYAMFFACGAWVLYIQSLDDVSAQKNNWLTFIAHFCLCQVHYLGIVFSLLSGISNFFTSTHIGWWKRIQMPIALCWLVSIVSYLFYLSRQESVLNTWPKPNEISDLIAGYNDSLIIIAILIPILALLLTNNPKKETEKSSIKKNNYSTAIMITSLLWFSLPFIFWVLSNLTPLNLFVDRYFIPKEAALIFLITYVFKFILQELPMKKSENIHILGTLGFSVFLILIGTKRVAFGLNKNTNYHHSLIIEETYPKSEQPINLKGDPKYFPNAYLAKNKYVMIISGDLINLYQVFNKNLRLSLSIK